MNNCNLDFFEELKFGLYNNQEHEFFRGIYHNLPELTDSEKRRINMIPAMIYHGVRSEEGVLLRMNSVPRSIAEALGSIMKESVSREQHHTVQDTRDFLKQSDSSAWEKAKPESSPLSGEEYKRIWQLLSGEDR